MATDDKIEIEIALKNAKEAVKTLENITKKSEELPKKTESAFKKVGTSISSGFQSIQKNFLLATAAITAGLASIKGAIDVTKEAAKFRQSTDAMFSQFGVNANEVISALKKVSDGTISNADLVSAANKTMALNVTRDVDKMAKLLEVARVRARAMGIDTTQAFEDIVTGIGRNSPLILDNLGIVTKGWDAEAKSAGVAYDTQFILNKVLEDGSNILSKTGELTLTSSERFDKLGASMSNIRVKVGDKLLPLFEGLAGALSLIVDNTYKLDQAEAERAKTMQQIEGVGTQILAQNGDKAAQDALRIGQIKKENNELQSQIDYIKTLGDTYTVWNNGVQKVRKSKDDIEQLQKKIKKNEKEISDIELAPARKKQAEEAVKLTAEEKELLLQIANTNEKIRNDEIKQLNSILDKVDATGEEKDLAFERLQIIYKEIEAEKENGDEKKKNLNTSKEQSKVNLSSISATAGATGELVSATQEYNEKSKSGFANSAAKANAIIGIIAGIIDLVKQLGQNISDLGNYITSISDEFGKASGFVSKFGQAISASGQGMTQWAENVKRGVPPLIALGVTIKNFADKNKDITQDIKDSWKDMYDDIVKEAQRATWEKQRLAAEEAYRAELEASGSYQLLKQLDEEDWKARRKDLVDRLATETDLDEKAAIERQIKRMDAEKEFEGVVAGAEATKTDTNRQIAYEQALAEYNAKLDELKTQYDKDKQAIKDAIMLPSKEKERLENLEADYKKAKKKLTPPAYAQGGSFVTSGPQLIRVGDNNGGRERVTVEPMNGGGSSGITLNNVTIQANDPQQFFNALNNYQRQYGVI